MLSEMENTKQAADDNTFSDQTSTEDQLDSRSQNEQAGATKLKGTNILKKNALLPLDNMIVQLTRHVILLSWCTDYVMRF